MDSSEQVSKPQVVAVPSDRAWLDPRLLVAMLETTTDDITISGNDVQQLVPPDPTRVGLMITFPNLLVPSVAYGPWPDLASFTYTAPAGGVPVLVTLREHLTLPTLAWYIKNADTQTVRITTFRRDK